MSRTGFKNKWQAYLRQDFQTSNRTDFTFGEVVFLAFGVIVII